MSIDQIHKIEQLNDHVYRIDENGIANCYLVIGSEKALLIDAGIGAGNLKKCVEQVTDKPIILAITHRHYDHVGGAWQFGTYYIHKYDSSFINKLMTYFLIANIVVEKQGISIENKRPLGRKVKEVKIEDLQGPGEARRLIREAKDSYHLSKKGLEGYVEK